MASPKSTRVSLRIPTEFHEAVLQTCKKTIRIQKKDFQTTKTKNEAYLDIIKRGLMTLDSEEDTN